ncbi:hypothetical protein FZ934_10180 [Rhizobium grahamii]|uniref:Uncharacterized protein n=1 Tax=Rhizobium grahamii TaxID=1120045 RepID=A0A5Q0C662_9HYPH|nr:MULTISPECIES: hypothetical protein [Rhizobium]QFY60755.1 hypothetical protein FZ934_10180 [Rhizobium grahamii]QRM50103.1 hypothetical protein F3Y33_12710 [Rhizobium sp. BG6]
MFLNDELAAGRLRARRVCISLMVAVVAVTASLVTTFSLVTAAYAGELPRTELRAMTADFNTALHGSKPVLKIASTENVHTDKQLLAASAAATFQSQADQQILHGLTALMLALTAISGMAVWRRRLHGLFSGEHA